jgi:hypothetical protein
VEGNVSFTDFLSTNQREESGALEAAGSGLIKMILLTNLLYFFYCCTVHFGNTQHGTQYTA